MFSPERIGRILRWWRLPFWSLAVFTGAKSFVDNPVLGSRRLNRAGLHVWRVKTAHALASRRRRRLARLLPATLRDEFDRNGFAVVRDFLPVEDFNELQSSLLGSELPTRVHQQGDTLTRRVAVDPDLRRKVPQLDRLLESPVWTGLMAYVASTRSRPLYYVQTILGGVAEGPPDPQLELHADTFHPSMKAWLFLTDVDEDGRPLTYVAGSHRASPERLDWERRKSITVLDEGDRLSERGSLRISPAELGEIGLPQPTRFAVPANTLVVIDTYGFHARGDSDQPTKRVELWAFSRRTPFLPWTGLDLLSWRPLADRRAQWISSLLDWADRRGWRKQHWTQAGLRRPIDP
ncbi:MAG: phytanoyl-CoA dioxygenase [Sphingomonas sp.]|nr:phytanoyl-CoA dioxygenase [Sphingomonas sp.]